MSTKQFLAVDLGAESGRTVIGRFDGHRLDLEETHRFPNGGVRVLNTLYWDVLRLWQEIKVGIGKSVLAAGPPETLGVDTWGVDFGLLGQDGNLLGNPVHYRDRRNDGAMEYAFQRVPRAEIYATTGLQFLKFNTLFQLLSLRRDRGAEAFSGVERILMIPDLFNYFLTGIQAAEFTIASTTQMLDPRRGTWSTSLLERLDIPRSILPEIVPTGQILGRVLPEIAAETHCAEMRVVASAGHDTAAAVVAVPGRGEDWCYISSGTWSLMGAELPAPAITEQTLADNFTNEGGIFQTVRFLKNIMGLWLVQECRRSFERSGRAMDYAHLMELAAESPAFGPILNPDDESFMVPQDMAAAIRNYCARTGQQSPADDGALVRCCLEGLAMRYRRTLEQMESCLGRRFSAIHIVGGGARNELLCQLTADCCGRVVVAGPVEATALGNCLVQAMASKEIQGLSQARDVVRASYQTRTFEPKPNQRWEEHYAQFLSHLAG